MIKLINFFYPVDKGAIIFYLRIWTHGGFVADKRNLKRHRKRMTLKFGIGGLSRVAFTEDISRQGMCIKTAFVHPPGSSIDIDLTLPDGTPVKLVGEVMWAKKVPPNMIHLIKKCGMGVRFTRIEAGAEAFERMCVELTGQLPPVPPQNFVSA